MHRTADIRRETGETRISLTLDLDGNGQSKLATGIGFFDHMLTLLAKHSLMDLTVEAQGDLHVDPHHTVEDVGICLGKALVQALGNKAGIRRYGHFTLPMDEVLVTSAVDLSGRAFCVWQADVLPEILGHLQCAAGGGILAGRGREWAHEPACALPPWAEYASHRRGSLQGDGAGPADGGRNRSARQRCAVHQGGPLEVTPSPYRLIFSQLLYLGNIGLREALPRKECGMKRVLVLAAALGMALNLVGCSSDPREGLVAAAVTDVDNAATKVTNIKVKIEDAVKKAEPGKAPDFKEALLEVDALKKIAKEMQELKMKADALKDKTTEDQKKELSDTFKIRLNTANERVAKAKKELNDTLVAAEAQRKDALKSVRDKLAEADGEFESISALRR